MVYRDLSILAGTAHPELAQAVGRLRGSERLGRAAPAGRPAGRPARELDRVVRGAAADR